jgi:hypothetical protein
MQVPMQPPIPVENLFFEPPTLSEESENSDDFDYQPFQEVLPSLFGTDNSASGSFPPSIFDLSNQSVPPIESHQLEPSLQISKSDTSSTNSTQQETIPQEISEFIPTPTC